MLTKKGKYGLKALVHLSGLPVGQLAFVNDIAVANNIPKKFLYAILGELRNAGFVQSRKGKEGGYRLARLQGFDMFPQTLHIETVAELMRQPSSALH